jgi:hypothetical protein
VCWCLHLLHRSLVISGVASGELECTSVLLAFVSAEEHQDDGQNKRNTRKAAYHTSYNSWGIERAAILRIGSAGPCGGARRERRCHRRTVSTRLAADTAAAASSPVEGHRGCCI